MNERMLQIFASVIARGGGAVYGPPISVDFNPTEDTYLRSDTPTTNYNADTGFYVGENASVVRTLRGLMRFSYAWFPSTGVISSRVLSLYESVEFANNARTMRIYEPLRAWVSAQATWNRYATGLDWQTAGGFGALDCEQTEIASRAFSATETTGEYKTFTLPGAALGDFEAQGLFFKMDTEDADQHGFISVDNATNKPYQTIVFTDLLANTTGWSAVGDSKTIVSVNTWPASLTSTLNVNENARYAKIGFAAASGRTVATAQDNIDAELAAITDTASKVFLNLGVNDAMAGLPAEAAWKADYLYILDALHTKWPGATVYLTRPWTRGEATDCNTLATWIADCQALRPTFSSLGDDERVWLEGGDDGVTMTTDGVHYSAAGQVEKVVQCKTLLGY